MTLAPEARTGADFVDLASRYRADFPILGQSAPDGRALIYLDHAATTPMRPEAIEAMTAVLASVGNAGWLKYHDVSVGKLVVEHKTKLGPCKALIDVWFGVTAARQSSFRDLESRYLGNSTWRRGCS